MSDSLRDDLADVIREHWDGFSVLTLADALMPRIEQAIAEARGQALEDAAEMLVATAEEAATASRDYGRGYSHAARVVRDLKVAP